MNKNLYKFDLGRWIIVSYLALIPYTTLVLSYFRVDQSASLSFLGNDGWCDVQKNEGIGVHCFGDLNQGMIDLDKYSWSYVTSRQWLTVADAVISRLTSLLGGLLSLKIALLIFILIYLIALYLPVRDLRKKLPNSNSKLFVTIIYFTSAPIMISLDRMNSICLLVPIIYFLAKALVAKNLKRATFLIALAVIIKPQTGLLLLLFPTAFSLISAAASTLITMSVFCISIWGLYGFKAGALSQYFSTLIEFDSTKLGLSNDYPSNYSFSRTIHFLIAKINPFFINEETVQIFAIIFVIISGSILLFYAHKNSIVTSMQILLVLAYLGIPRVAGGYYLAVILVLEFARKFESNAEDLLDNRGLKSTNLQTFLRKILIFLIVLPLPIPYFGKFPYQPQDVSQNEIFPILNPILINLTLIVYIIFTLLNLKKSEREKLEISKL